MLDFELAPFIGLDITVWLDRECFTGQLVRVGMSRVKHGQTLYAVYDRSDGVSIHFHAADMFPVYDSEDTPPF